MRFQRVVYPAFFKEADLGATNAPGKSCSYDCSDYNGYTRSELACNGTVSSCNTVDYIDSCSGKIFPSRCIDNKHLIYNLNGVYIDISSNALQ